MYPRLLEGALRESLADTPAVFVAGARQTGKSTLVRGFGRRAGGWTYRTFDDLETLASARADPQGLVARLGDRAILDEVQRAPELLVPLKASIDADRRPGRFILTGSANVLALPRVAESLAGRMEILTLWPLAQSELERTTPRFVDACFDGWPDRLRPTPADRGALAARMLRGGFPEAAGRLRDRARGRWFGAYLSTLLQRDLRDLAAIERIAEVPRLLEAVAARTGSLLNVADVGRALGINHMTLKRYLALLEALYLVVRLPPWFENAGKRLTRTPKLHLVDSGLLAYLLGLDAAGLAARPAGMGPLAETFVVAELLRIAPVSSTCPRLFHFRTGSGHEVDVVLEDRRRRLVGVEVKASASVTADDFRGLRTFQEVAGKRFACGVLLHAGREILPFGPRLWAAPISSLWG
ncbi:MAG TPA: ATP-binding protein [Anaeromyxobacteraceae bacterium]|nr:ATP-binding protein [Anaeromyxobacteraceae bacterium]